MTERKLKAAVIGSKSVAALYGAAGVAVFEPSDDISPQKLIAKLDSEGYGIIFMTETVYKNCEEAAKKYLTDPYPIIIPVPDEYSDGTYSKERIAANIKKAIGSDLI